MTGRASGPYVLVVRFELLDGHEEAFDALVARTVGGISSEEPGTLIYLTHIDDLTHVDTREAQARVFYEMYRDREAFDAHEAMPHVRRFLEERSAHLREEPLVWRVALGAGVIREGIEFSSA